MRESKRTMHSVEILRERGVVVSEVVPLEKEEEYVEKLGLMAQQKPRKSGYLWGDVGTESGRSRETKLR